MKIKLKNNVNGITLIALVVTIVVLLILAGVTITAVLGEDGIIEKAKEAKRQTEEAIENQEQDMADLLNEIEGILGDDPVVKNAIAQEYGKKQEKNKTITVGSSQVTIPQGYTLVNPIQDTTVKYADNNNPKIDEGIVIKDDLGNEFVWVPITNINDMVMCQTHPTSTITFDEETGKFSCNGETGGQTHQDPLLAGKLYASSAGNTFNANNPNKIYNENGGLREPAIVTNSEDGNGTEYDAAEENLKIVVEDESKTKDQFKEQLQNEFNEMAKSVAKYNGFYIGRYETGNLESQDSKPVVQKYNTEIGNVNWYWQYKNSKKIAQTDSGVKSSMIWGSQWDAVMKWFIGCDLNDYVTISKVGSDIKGYYNDNTVSYKTNKEDTTENSANGDNPIPTGGSEQTKVKNIYDMAGNIYDWTIEACEISYHMFRGR